MRYRHINSLDSVETMIQKLQTLSKYLDKITGNFIAVSDYGKKYQRSSCLYTPYTCIKIRYQLDLLTQSIEDTLKAAKTAEENLKYGRLEMDAKRILLATYESILDPTSTTLHDLSCSVTGAANLWMQAGLIAGIIAGLLLGVIPGIMLAILAFEPNGLWVQFEPKGLALEANHMYQSIPNVNYGYNGLSYRLFSNNRDDIAKAINEKMKPPIEEVGGNLRI